MIEKLSIHNFQIHKNFHLHLDPLLTTIIGPTDSGKSAVVRALRWLATNKPRGTNFINHEEHEARVRLVIDGYKIIRKQGNENIYKLNDEQALYSFGTTVPDKIEKLLNLGQVNFQYQHDSPFWFMKTAGEVSRELNQIINLDLIDKSLAYLKSLVQTIKSVVTFTKKRLTDIRKRRYDLSWVEESNKEFQEIEKTNSEIKERELTYQQIKEITESIEKQEDIVKEGKRILVDAKELNSLTDKIESINEEEVKIKEILEELKEQTKLAEKQIPKDEARAIEVLAEKLNKISLQKENLGVILKESKALEEFICQTNSTIAQQNAELKKQKHCPVCGNPI